MQSAVRNGTRIIGGTRSAATTTTRRNQSSWLQPKARGSPWTCAECRFKAQRLSAKTASGSIGTRRDFSSSLQRRDDRPSDTKQPISPTSIASPDGTQHDTPASSPEVLPSHVERQRWQFSKDTTKFIDSLLARASIAGQHINVYTGTDYSGIETLRSSIIAQEQKVKNNHAAVEEAKTYHQEAWNKQASAQKEIVSLLERKASWSPTDLERYMSLVRSEHLNDQAVQAAKDKWEAAERELEDTRSLLEKLERKQYHEEQIWSDTIRRNSTWVTFGLMGVNIVLLLAQILVFEPYRRRKIVRDMKEALNEKTLTGPSAEAKTQVDEVVQPAVTPIETVEEAAHEAQSTTQPLDTLLPEKEDAGKTPLAAGEVLPEEATVVSETPGLAEGMLQPPKEPTVWEAYQATLLDLFSERLIQIKQVELTHVALQGAATGVAAMGLLFVLLRPK